nr:uncharacterized zinc finger CCHC domain-containing protein At4g19190 [Tanacetum cinerariifolium]
PLKWELKQKPGMSPPRGGFKPNDTNQQIVVEETFDEHGVGTYLSCEPLKWELKQKPGMSPPRGGFKPNDTNQQIVVEETFDEHG